MRRPAVVATWATWEEALAEANRLAQVYAAKFPSRPPRQYVIRKRRSEWPPGVGGRRWNAGRHDRWHVLTGPAIPDRMP